jgi:AcrR family transcriptional regulator
MAPADDTTRSKSLTWVDYDAPAVKKRRVKAHIFEDAPRAESRRKPHQDRAKFTVAAILEAAAEVIDDVGWAHASTNRIAERAGVSIGSLYQYFPNKEAILSSLVETHRHGVHSVVAEALTRLGDPEISVEEALRWLFEELVRVHQDDPVLTRVLSTQVPHPKTGEGNRGETDELVLRLQEILVRRSDVHVRDWMAAAHVVATATEALTRWLAHEAPDDLATATLIDEIVAMLAGYLTKQ